MDAIFSTVGQALHVSYLMEVLPVTQRVSTQVLIDSLRKSSGVTDETPASDRAVNFGGLSPLEVRGQCAMVRQAVTDHLAEPERHAVQARYGHKATQATGVKALAEYLAPVARIEHQTAMLALTWALYQRSRDRRGRHREDRITLRQIEAECGVPRSTVGRAQLVVRHHAQALERRAEAGLRELFERTDLCGIGT